MNDSDRTRLTHMLEYAEEAIGLADARSRLTLLAVMRTIEIVGEAASKVSIETRQSIPEIPWSKIIGIRNRLAHAYADVNEAIIWDTVNESLPDLVTRLRAILNAPSPP